MQWQAMLLLGAYHGINPGMGWLFAVALGMQQRSARGVYRALPPIALGHALSVGAVLLLAGVLQTVVDPATIRVVVAVLLITLGAYRLWRHRHPRFGGMQVGFRDLAIWSFLMASAHGAGLMLLPFVLGMPIEAAAAASMAHAGHATSGALSVPATSLMAIGVHTLAYLAVMTAVAWIVYWKLGLAILRTAWFNLDWLWAAALVLTGGVLLVSGLRT
jgi:hypothetical protein